MLDVASSARSLSLREDAHNNIFVDGLRHETIESCADALKLLQRGGKQRRVAATRSNDVSSRSHAVFSVHIVSTSTDAADGAVERTSRLHLVDLAGSERQKSAQTSGVQLKEGAAINKSLAALGNVIRGLIEVANGRERFVPYRDSRLTLLLRVSSLFANQKNFLATEKSLRIRLAVTAKHASSPMFHHLHVTSLKR